MNADENPLGVCRGSTERTNASASHKKCMTHTDHEHCSGCVCVASFRHWRSGKRLIAAHYGLRAFCFCPHKKHTA